jgi:hypothetical protein
MPGYRVEQKPSDKEPKGILAVNEDEARIVRLILERYQDL